MSPDFSDAIFLDMHMIKISSKIIISFKGNAKLINYSQRLESSDASLFCFNPSMVSNGHIIL